MHQRTVATLETLRQVEWFRNVGIHDTEAADVLCSWDEAFASCSSPEWEGLCLEAAHQYSERLRERSPERIESWNDVVNIVKPHSQDLVLEKTRAMVRVYAPPKIFLDTVEWDVLHLCMESEYSDIYPPGFYASQAYWYTKGHFPCGWRGSFPLGGRLIIY